MKKFLQTNFSPTVLDNNGDNLISIYMPTHRVAPDNKVDVKVFKNLINNLDSSKNPKAIDLLKKLEADVQFWLYNLDGLAVLTDGDDFNIYRLPNKVKEYVSLGSRYHLKPLIKNIQDANNYYILGLARDNFTLYYGNQYEIKEVEISEEKRLLKHVIGDQIDGKRINVASHGGSVGNIFGHTSKSAEIRLDTEKFFAYVNKFIYDEYTNKDDTPLILVSLLEHQGLFRHISKNSYLLREGVNLSYESINTKQLLEQIKPVIKNDNLEKVNKIVEQYKMDINANKAVNTIQETLSALLDQRVYLLAVASNKVVNGKLDLENNMFKVIDDGEDVLNHLLEIALKQEIRVLVLDDDVMPDNNSVFALLRY